MRYHRLSSFELGLFVSRLLPLIFHFWVVLELQANLALLCSDVARILNFLAVAFDEKVKRQISLALKLFKVQGHAHVRFKLLFIKLQHPKLP